ncbi:TetR/AcrR family transcriptional regulator [Kitasatospora aureofaciens]|uniref:TetR/AcrR family transcriptional regulator n=1 Tax=Kitasatospora aureofaciens TaxID=1894 RepID=UPI0037C6A324
MTAKKPGRAEHAPAAGRAEAVAAGTAPLRADARRNRARVLQAAHEAFAAEGLAVPLDEIARRAGVGAGTVHRHFPTKEALFEAVMLNRVQETVAAISELAATQEPGPALFAALTRMVDEGGVKKDLADALAGAGVDVTGSSASVTRELTDVLDELLTRAQQEGAVRKDIGVAELMAVIAGVFLATRRSTDRDFARRVLNVVLDGLRAVS